MGYEEIEDVLHPPIPSTPPVTPPPEYVVEVDPIELAEGEVLRVTGADGRERTVVLPPTRRSGRKPEPVKHNEAQDG
jgi:hypothetical protein